MVRTGGRGGGESEPNQENKKMKNNKSYQTWNQFADDDVNDNRHQPQQSDLFSFSMCTRHIQSSSLVVSSLATECVAFAICMLMLVGCRIGYNGNMCVCGPHFTCSLASSSAHMHSAHVYERKATLFIQFHSYLSYVPSLPPHTIFARISLERLG